MTTSGRTYAQAMNSTDSATAHRDTVIFMTDQAVRCQFLQLIAARQRGCVGRWREKVEFSIDHGIRFAGNHQRRDSGEAGQPRRQNSVVGSREVAMIAFTLAKRAKDK